jgi:DNA primase
MKDYRKETEELNQIPIHTVGTMLGLRLPRKGSAHCPFEDHEDKNPSFEIKERTNKWICYGCGRKGGAIDLVKECLSISFSEAKKWLVVKAGKSWHAQKSYEKSRPSNLNSFETQAAKPEELPDFQVYERLSELCPLQSNGQDYLVKRGIKEETIKTFKISQLGRQLPVITNLLSEFGWERLKKSGVLTKKSTERRCRLVFAEGSIIFPFIETGRIAYLQARNIEEIIDVRKWMNLNGRRHRIFNIDTLSQENLVGIAICEGVMDTLSAIELGFKAIGLMGVSAILTTENIKRLKGKRVDILLDWDERGNERAAQLQHELKLYGVVSTRKMRPSSTAKDLNEYLVETRRLT